MLLSCSKLTLLEPLVETADTTNDWEENERQSPQSPPVLHLLSSWSEQQKTRQSDINRQDAADLPTYGVQDLKTKSARLESGHVKHSSKLNGCWRLHHNRSHQVSSVCKPLLGAMRLLQQSFRRPVLIDLIMSQEASISNGLSSSVLSKSFMSNRRANRSKSI